MQYLGYDIREFLGNDITGIKRIYNFPDQLVGIFAGVFNNCKNLVILPPFPKTLKFISDDAFSGCTNLTTLTFNSKVKMTPNVFIQCYNFTEIIVYNEDLYKYYKELLLKFDFPTRIRVTFNYDVEPK